MSGIKKLAGQTLWYGGSSILARMINYLITPYLIYKLPVEGFGDNSLIYASISFLNIIFTYGMETAFFRFAKNGKENDVYNTSLISILVSTILFSGVLLFFYKDIAGFLKLEAHPEFVMYFLAVIALDAITTLPFALLRLQGRPVRFASIRITNVLVYAFTTYFFISILPGIVQRKPQGLLSYIYKENYQVGYVIIANLIASFITLLQLRKAFSHFRFRFNGSLWKEIMLYSLPMIIVGLGGMVNETADRFMLNWWGPAATDALKKVDVAIYSANYKLSILITLFIQAFRMGAEPFFFKQAEGKDPQKVYARVMKFFVIVICSMFLFVGLYLDVWKHLFLTKPEYWEGIKIVPILLLANMFLGVYYNLSIWYKIKDKTLSGAYITIIGALVTFVINYIFIPKYNYVASAWATFAAYGTMMVISYLWGQKVYPVPYPMKKIGAYFFFALMVFFASQLVGHFFDSKWLSAGVGTILFIIYLWFISIIEHKELSKLPVVGKYFYHSLPSGKTIGE